MLTITNEIRELCKDRIALLRTMTEDDLKNMVADAVQATKVLATYQTLLNEALMFTEHLKASGMNPSKDPRSTSQTEVQKPATQEKPCDPPPTGFRLPGSDIPVFQHTPGWRACINQMPGVSLRQRDFATQHKDYTDGFTSEYVGRWINKYSGVDRSTQCSSSQMAVSVLIGALLRTGIIYVAGVRTGRGPQRYYRFVPSKNP